MRALHALVALAALPALAEVGQIQPTACRPFVPTSIEWSHYEDGYFIVCNVRVAGLADDRSEAKLRFQGESALPRYPWWFGHVSTQSETRCLETLEAFEDYALYVLNGSDERYCGQTQLQPCPPANPYQHWVTHRLEAACGRCDATQAPNAVTLVPNSDTFFHVDLGLDSGATVRIGFEYDGDRWEHAEQYGDTEGCTGQLQTFVDYTLAILAADACTAQPAYSAAEETRLADYVGQVGQFCQANR